MTGNYQFVYKIIHCFRVFFWYATEQRPAQWRKNELLCEHFYFGDLSSSCHEINRWDFLEIIFISKEGRGGAEASGVTVFVFPYVGNDECLTVPRVHN